MNGETGNDVKDAEVVDDVEDVEDIAAPEDTVVITEDMADIEDLGATTIVDIDKLVAKLDKVDDQEHKKAIKRRLEELEEEKREAEELDSTYNFNLNDDL